MVAKKKKVKRTRKVAPQTAQEQAIATLLEAREGLYRIALSAPCVVEMRLKDRTVGLKFYTADTVAALEASN